MMPNERARAGRVVAMGLAFALVVAACSSDDGGDPSGAQRATGEDLIGEVEIVEGPNSTISAVLSAETTAPSTMSVEAEAEAGGPTVVVPSIDGSTTSHTVPIVGLRADTTYTVTVQAEGDDGSEESVALDWTTGSLPDGLPPLTLAVSETERMAPGVTIFNALWWGPPEPAEGEEEPEDAEVVPPPENLGVLIGVDDEAEVVWYYQTPLPLGDVSPTTRGTLLVSVNDVLLREIDMLGNTVREWGSLVATDYVDADLRTDLPFVSDETQPAATDSFHHELTELPSGNLLTISTRLLELDPVVAEALCPGEAEATIVEDVVVEIEPDGEVVREWPLSDYYDPATRPGAEMCNADAFVLAPPNWFYPDAGGTRDWTHANAAVVDESSNTLLVSVRHLDSVLGIRYEGDESGPAGELLWDLSSEGTLELLSGESSLHQHAVEPQADGTILLYDNGNLRPGTVLADGDAPPYSRAVVYRIDPAAGTAEQVWEHRDVTPEGAPQYTAFLGDADRQPNGNVLITHGGGRTEDGVLYARIVEVVPGATPADNEVVFDLTVGDRAEIGWTVYRADRLPSLYFTGMDLR